jgi:hypothetical protein
MRQWMIVAALLPMLGGTALAQETVKIGYIDPLSGGGASVGEVGFKTFQFLADELNAKGGILGKKVEIVPFDNKTNPQESLIQTQKAIDAGVRYVTQGNGSSVAGALTDFVTKYNERNPLFQLCRGGSYPHQCKVQLLAFPLGCKFRHQDGSAHELHEERFSHQEALSDQPGLFVR